MTDSVADLLGARSPSAPLVVLCLNIYQDMNHTSLSVDLPWSLFILMNFRESNNCISMLLVYYMLVSLSFFFFTSDTIKQDQAAVLCYLRMRHKVPLKGYILCGIVRVYNHHL